MNYFDLLPDELLLHIFSYLSPVEDVVHGVARVSNRFRCVAKDARLWGRVSVKFGDPHFMCVNLFAPTLWQLELSDMEDSKDGIALDLIMNHGPEVVRWLHVMHCRLQPLSVLALIRKYKHCLEVVSVLVYDPYVREEKRALIPLLASLPFLRILELNGTHHASVKYDVSNGFNSLKQLSLYRTYAPPSDVDPGLDILRAKGSQLESLSLYQPSYAPTYIPSSRDPAMANAIANCSNLKKLHLEGTDYTDCLQVLDIE